MKGKKKKKEREKVIKDYPLDHSFFKKPEEETESEEVIDIVEEVNQGREEAVGIGSKNETIKELAENILSAREALKEAKKSLVIKKLEVSRAEIENLRRATLVPPIPADDLSNLKNEIVEIEVLLESQKKYYFALDKFARSNYPKIFKRQKK